MGSRSQFRGNLLSEEPHTLWIVETVVRRAMFPLQKVPVLVQWLSGSTDQPQTTLAWGQKGLTC